MVKVTKSSLKTEEKIIEIDNPSLFKCSEVFPYVLKYLNENDYVIKCNLVKSTRNKLYFNLVYIKEFCGFIDKPFIPVPVYDFKSSDACNISCMIIPTGVGASFGGYAGDANPIANLIAASSKYFLTHPNVVNGAVLTDVPENLIYLEGFLLDQFLIGKINLIPNKINKIGVIFDKGISDERLEYELNVLNGVRAFYGCEILAYTVTREALSISPSVTQLGFSTGTIKNLHCLIDSAVELKGLGVTAIAICCAIPDLELNNDYLTGKGIDPVGGIESIISHVVSAVTGLVSAHAPVLISEETIDYKNILPVSAGEYIAKTFLPSVISGLRFAPKIFNSQFKQEGLKSFYDLSKIIVPYNAFGSPGVLYLNEQFRNVSLIRENKSCLDVNPHDLNIDFNIVESFTDLIDLQFVKEQGIDIGVLKRPLHKIQTV